MINTQEMRNFMLFGHPSEHHIKQYFQATPDIQVNVYPHQLHKVYIQNLKTRQNHLTILHKTHMILCSTHAQISVHSNYILHIHKKIERKKIFLAMLIVD